MKSLKSSTPAGLTLVEVVAGLALMGTLLTTVIIGSTQHARQAKAASRKRIAVEKLDQLLGEWSLSQFDESKFDQAAANAGFLNTETPHATDKHYQVSVSRTPAASFTRASVLRLEVNFRQSARLGQRITWAEILVPSKEVVPQ